MIYKRAQEFARNCLNKERFEHSLNTAQSAYDIANAYGVDPERAYLSGLLHDVARDLAPQEILRQAAKEGIIPRKEERICPFLLHGKVGAQIVKDEIGLKDQGVLNAISFHVTGRPNWTRLEQVLYLADKTEPERLYPGVGQIRSLLAEGDFEGALFECLRENIIYAAKTQGWIVDTDTVVIFNGMATRF
ncbi:MAG: bis(5'-nucleosyl)-tetraphosphatase (symmetrical) YqeK [Firmicutes bacterium]|nr:bis(5'-nucleosyl)-tetraphosphatase (symmetrical) YqeK [Candidatus Fermentithermobacillaceae bacterium]